MELLTQIPNSIFLQENQERECFITRPFPFLTITTKDPFRLLPKLVPKGRVPTSHVASVPEETTGVGNIPHALWVFSSYFIFLSSWEILKLNFPIKFPQALVVSSNKITLAFC